MEVKYEYTWLPLVKVSPNRAKYSEYVVTIVGISTGPLIVGPIIAAPIWIGWLLMIGCSFSIVITPGEN
tara:strand:- start:343 stop:549 length:207 start_codon:yes stop_codon:yes gene_type:complete